MEKYRIVEGIGVYFITFTVVEWLPVFVNEAACKIITDSLNFCIQNKNLCVNAYVIMPTHLHAIVFDTDFDATRLKQTMDDFRKFTGRQMADHCAKTMSSEITDVFRKHAGNDRQRRFWQPTQHPVGIIKEKFYKQKVDYIHLNPVRKGLVRFAEDWRFSSAAYWITGKTENIDVELADLPW